MARDDELPSFLSHHCLPLRAEIDDLDVGLGPTRTPPKLPTAQPTRDKRNHRSETEGHQRM